MTERKWWLGPTCATVFLLLNTALILIDHDWFLNLPGWFLAIDGLLFYTIGICLPMIWAASTNKNPYYTQKYCKKHHWWYSEQLGCDYCEDKNHHWF